MAVSTGSTNVLTRRFPAFESVDYRRLFLSASFTSASAWMMFLARGWLVFELSGSTTVVGIVTFAGMIPSAIVGPIGGAIADRFDRRRLAMFASASGIGVHVVLATLTLTGVVEAWHVIALAAIGGAAWSSGTPAQDALLPSLLRSPDHLMNGVALSGIARHGSRLLGPSFGAAMLATAGVGYVFLIAAGFLALSFWQLYLIEFRPSEGGAAPTVIERPPLWRSLVRDLADGVAYIKRDPRVTLIVVLVMLHCGLTMAFDSMLPTLATMVGGAGEVYGAIIVGLGIGAFASTIGLSVLGNTPVRGGALAVAGVGSGVAMVILGVATNPATVIAGAILAGGSQSAFVVLLTIFLQQVTPDEYRGRVLSIYTMIAVGHMAFLNFGYGWLADGVGVRPLLIVPGVLWVSVFVAGAMTIPELRHLLRRGDFRPRAIALDPVLGGD